LADALLNLPCLSAIAQRATEGGQIKLWPDFCRTLAMRLQDTLLADYIVVKRLKFKKDQRCPSET